MNYKNLSNEELIRIALAEEQPEIIMELATRLEDSRCCQPPVEAQLRHSQREVGVLKESLKFLHEQYKLGDILIKGPHLKTLKEILE